MVEAVKAKVEKLFNPEQPMKTKSAKDAQIQNNLDEFLARLPKVIPAYKPGPLERKFRNARSVSTDERQVHAFLKNHDFLVGMTFHSNTHPRGVVSEFELGAEFRCDFLVLSCCSAWWSADFVELKAPNARLYLKDGTASKSLRIANREVRDWKQWTRENEPYLRSRLSNLFERLDLSASGATEIPDAATEIRDPHCALNCSFHILIGRRAELSPPHQRARVQESLDGRVGIATYDRIVESARRYDQGDKFSKEGFRYRKG